MKKHNILLLSFIFSIMIIIAMGDNVRGVFIPQFKIEFKTQNTQMGIMLMICSLGYMTFTYFGGILCEIIGQKKVMLMGLILCILSLLGLYFSPSFPFLLIGLFVLNSGVALLAIGINTLIPILLIGFQATLMNLIHFFYGLGATITQRTAGWMLYKGVSWREIYLFLGIIFMVVFIGFLFVHVPKSEGIRTSNKIKYKAIFSNKMLYFYIFALGLYVAAELGTGNWFINFMRGSYGFDENKSAFYSSLFFGVFTIGRLFGGFIIERFNHIKSVFLSLTLGFLLYLLGLLLKDVGVIFISISGIFFAIAFPTIVVTIRSVFPSNSSYITGIIITSASAMSMLVNLFLGWLNDIIGVYRAFYLIPISLLISIIFVYLIYKERIENVT